MISRAEQRSLGHSWIMRPAHTSKVIHTVKPYCSEPTPGMKSLTLTQ